MTRFVVVANPAGKRLAHLQRALADAGLPPPTVVPWLELLRGTARLEDKLEPRAATALRLDSPGEDPTVERELIALGADVADPDHPRAARIDATTARGLPEDRGRIVHPRQWSLGFERALERIEQTLAAAPPAAVTNLPADVACMFDKRRCHARLRAAGVEVPESLGPVQGWEELRTRMAELRRPRVFVKLAGSSSASGVVALETQGARLVARTTVQLVRSGDAGEARLYNVKRVHRYTDAADVAAIVDAILREGAQVEAWFPKAGLEGRAFDLRVVVIGGRPRHVVVRTSRGPLTNLHIGGDNRRGDPGLVRERLGEAAWSDALDVAARAAACFPRTLLAGVDVAVHAGRRRVAVLEVNAFGDLLPGALHEGQDTYAAQVAAVVAGAPA